MKIALAIFGVIVLWAGNVLADELVLRTKQADYRFDIEVVANAAARNQGLMGRLKLDENQGMLFVFDAPRDDIVMWMKQTYISLDMVFMDRQGVILAAHRNAVPLSLAHIVAPKGTFAVLEINAGLVDALGLAAGQQVAHGAFAEL